MAHLLHQRCFHHALREAVARCPECRQFYCRECITEHEDRVLCATCLKKQVQATRAQGRSFAFALRAAQGVAGLFTVWLFFYLLGQGLLRLPSSFHEGTLWQDPWLNRP